MNETHVTSTVFQNKAGQYLDQSAKEPVIITRHSRPVRVLMDIEEYERLKSFDTRQALYPHELSGELRTELTKGFKGEETPELDHLME